MGAGGSFSRDKDIGPDAAYSFPSNAKNKNA
jgi:hypothetical protein